MDQNEHQLKPVPRHGSHDFLGAARNKNAAPPETSTSVACTDSTSPSGVRHHRWARTLDASDVTGTLLYGVPLRMLPSRSIAVRLLTTKAGGSGGLRASRRRSRCVDDEPPSRGVMPITPADCHRTDVCI